MKQLNGLRLKQGRMAALPVAVGLLVLFAVPSFAAERSLAGIKIFSTARPVLAKYGNPSQVIVGRPSLTPTSGSAAVSQSGQSGAPSIAPGALPGFGSAPPELGGGGSGPLPGFGGGQQGGPGSYPPPGGAGQAGANGQVVDPSNGEVTWIYNRPGGSDVEFTFSSDGRVVQIRATGYQGPFKTSKGIGLGAKYATVIGKYGFPESQEQDGGVLTARYTERSHAAFQFLNQRVVAVLVAAVE